MDGVSEVRSKASVVFVVDKIEEEVGRLGIHEIDESAVESPWRV